MEGDRERTIERREKLEEMVREAFPDKSINILTKKEYRGDDPDKWRIRIVEPKKPYRRLVLFPTREFMTDVGIPFNRIVKEAIEFVKQKLNLSQGGFLGNLILKTTGIEWKATEEQEG